MRTPDGHSGIIRLSAALSGSLPVIWLALRISPSLSEGAPGIIKALSEAVKDPFEITLNENSLRCVLIFLLIYSAAVCAYIFSLKNFRRGEEHGSAKWGNVSAVRKKYADLEDFTHNKILTENVMLSYDTRMHRRNLNVLVVGGSGSGKTRCYAKPNIMSCSGKDSKASESMIVLDPKGELCRSAGSLLAGMGYKIKVLDLVDTSKSACYNPFVYLRCDNDIQKLVTNIYKNTQNEGSKNQDPFWDEASMMLLLALIFYLHYEAPPNEQNFPMVMDMIRAGEVREENDRFRSALDLLFDDLEKRKPGHIALKYYKSYRSGAGKTLKSIQITLLSRLEKFNLPSISKITMKDELELDHIGTEKTALFAVVPDNDTSFNFIIGMLYTQLFQELYRIADSSIDGKLPVHVHFIMDEFANCALPDSFDKLLSTMRSREISVSIIIQNLAQLKALYEKNYESIIGNCDTFLYLGGNEQSTHEYISKLLGKETIDFNTFGKTSGKSGSYSKNLQISGRDLLSPDEVRRLDNDYALLFIRGELPVIDRKYDISAHPRLGSTSDGGREPFVHGRTDDVQRILDEGNITSAELMDISELTDEESEKEEKGALEGDEREIKLFREAPGKERQESSDDSFRFVINLKKDKER